MSILKKIFNDFIHISKISNTNIFLIYGTLLGKIRNNNIICYDFDLDFGILFNIFKKYLILFYKNNNKYIVKNKSFLWYHNIEVIHKKTRLSADISSFSIHGNKISRDVPALYTLFFLKECKAYYPLNWFFPLKPVSFLDKTVFIPNNSNKLLQCYYGKNYLNPDHICNSDCTKCIKK